MTRAKKSPSPWRRWDGRRWRCRRRPPVANEYSPTVDGYIRALEDRLERRQSASRWFDARSARAGMESARRILRLRDRALALRDLLLQVPDLCEDSAARRRWEKAWSKRSGRSVTWEAIWSARARRWLGLLAGGERARLHSALRPGVKLADLAFDAEVVVVVQHVVMNQERMRRSLPRRLGPKWLLDERGHKLRVSVTQLSPRDLQRWFVQEVARHLRRLRPERDGEQLRHPQDEEARPPEDAVPTANNPLDAIIAEEEGEKAAKAHLKRKAHLTSMVDALPTRRGDVVRLRLRGMARADIGRRLKISDNTAKAHLRLAARNSTIRAALRAIRSPAD